MNKNLKNAGAAVLFALVPLAACIIYAALQGVMIWDLNPLAVQLPQWCDEVYYYIQVESIANNGAPLGYLGFNESFAPTGTLGAWSVFVLWPYVLLGKIFGATPFNMIFFNIIFVVLAFGVFYCLVQPTLQQCAKIAVLFAAVPVFTRYILSGMSEALFFAGMVVVAAFTLRFMQGKCCRISIALCYFVIVWLALCRPYYLAFILIPMYYHFKMNWKECVLGAVVAVVVFGGLYVFFVQPRCAEYFFPIVDISLFKLLFTDGPLVFIKEALYLFWTGAKTIVKFTLKGTWEAAVPFEILFVTTLAVLAVTVIRFAKGRTVKDDKAVTGTINVVIVAAIVAALILLYVEYTSARHIIAICLYMVIMTAMYLPDIRKPATVAVAMVVAYIGCSHIGAVEMTYKLSTDADQFGTLPVAADAEKLEQAFEVKEGVSYWENTVDYIYATENMNYLYCLPDFAGANICEESFIDANAATLQAKYLMTPVDTEKAENYISAGWEIILQGEEFTLFERAE